MSDAPDDALARVPGRRGHFLMESGYHADLWLDLDNLFADPARIAPSIAKLAALLGPHDVAAVCGPLLGGAFLAQGLAREMGVAFAYTERSASPTTDGLYRARYRLPASGGERLRGRRVALVDDVMSAGSSLRATHDALTACGAQPVVVGSLMVLGTRGSDGFAALNIPVETLSRRALATWAPDDCPLCRSGMPFEDVARIDG